MRPPSIARAAGLPQNVGKVAAADQIADVFVLSCIGNLSNHGVAAKRTAGPPITYNDVLSRVRFDRRSSSGTSR